MAIALVSGSVYGDAAGDYETLFGAEARKIAATASKTDDAEFAAKLVALGKDMTDAPDAQVFFWRKAIDFASTGAAGYKTALEAIALLQEAEPEKKDQWLDKKLLIAKGRYAKSPLAKKKAAARAYMELLDTTADAKLASGKSAEAKVLYTRAIALATYIGASDRAEAIGAKRKGVDVTAARDAQLKSLHAKLTKDPGDFIVRQQLVILYIVDRDAPAEAGKLLSDDLDEALRTYVTLAGKDVAELEEIACRDMGHWYYKTLYEKASATGKPIVLRRAQSYYQRFLTLQTKGDMQTVRVKMSLQNIDKALAELAKSKAPSPSKPKGISLPKYRVLELGKGVRMKLVLIKAGKFMMGEPALPNSSSYGESPPHEVTISKPFYMGLTEVTQLQYAAMGGGTPSRYKAAACPVDTVSWVNATAFCAALSRKTGAIVHLPTEAQWEYACRAGRTPYTHLETR